MRFRMWFFSFFALAAVGWLCLGLSATQSAMQQTSATLSATAQTKTDKLAYNTGVAIGGGLGFTFFACTGIPLFSIFTLLAWRNQAGMRTQKRHEEQLAAKEREIEALRAMKQQ